MKLRRRLTAWDALHALAPSPPEPSRPDPSVSERGPLRQVKRGPLRQVEVMNLRAGDTLILHVDGSVPPDRAQALKAQAMEFFAEKNVRVAVVSGVTRLSVTRPEETS